MKFFKKERKPLEIPVKILFLVRWFLEIVVNYSIIMVLAVYAVPMLLITLAKYIGISYDSELVDLMVLFVLPALFVVGICLMIYYFVMKMFHKSFNKIYDKAVSKYRAIDDEAKAEKSEIKSKQGKRLRKHKS